MSFRTFLFGHASLALGMTSGFVMLNEVKHPWVDSFARTGKVNPCEIGSIRPVRIPFAWIPRCARNDTSGFVMLNEVKHP